MEMSRLLLISNKRMEKKYMQILRNKTTAIMIALLLVISMSASMMLLPATNAHTPPWTVKTYCFLDVNPDPIGVGQIVYVTFGIDKAPPTANARYGDRWTNLTITITYPDSTTKTLSGFMADDTGFAYTTFTPDKIGNYTFVCNFLGQTLTGANPPPTGNTALAQQFIGDYYSPSQSTPATLYVTNEQIGTLPMNPLPTNYWQRPINMMNSNWNTVSGNWLGMMSYTNAGYGYNSTTNFNPYVQLGNSAHILWTTPLAPGGLIGGDYGDTAHSNYYSTAQYECKFRAVILNSVLYYTLTPGSSANYEGCIAQDLKTGEILWHSYTMNGTVRCGQIYNYISPNQYGGLAYLWTTSGTTYSMYDAMTGQWILDIAGGNTGATLMSSPDDGSLLAYYIDTTNTSRPLLTCWNSSLNIQKGTTGTGDPSSWSWKPTQGGKLNWTYGIQWQAPVATSINGNPISLSLSNGQSSGSIGITGDAIVVGQGTTGNWENWQIDAAYSIIDGHQLFLVNRTVSEWTRVVTYTIGEGKYIEMNNEDETINCFSADTGALLWTATFPHKTIWGYFSAYRPISAYGMVYDSTFDGHCYAFNETTGELVWDWWAGPSGYDTVYGSWPVKVVELVADGKVYLNGGHTYNPPLYRGAQAYCLNATTGELIWQVDSFCESNSPVVAAADGVLLLPNAYDNQLYAYGVGQSATTIDAPSTAVTFGSSVTIRGTVTDQSPGSTCLGIPAAGTPAISDASMSSWMNYLYQQQPKPTNATGVPVTLSVIDANGNTREIGTTTSNADGFYSFSWLPDIEGKYTVYAKFGGTESYYPSQAVTAFTVDPAAPTLSPTQPPAQSMVDQYFIPAIAATILAIVVCFAVTIVLLRKRP